MFQWFSFQSKSKVKSLSKTTFNKLDTFTILTASSFKMCMFTEASFTLSNGTVKKLKFQKNGYPINSWRAPPRKFPDIIKEIKKSQKFDKLPDPLNVQKGENNFADCCLELNIGIDLEENPNEYLEWDLINININIEELQITFNYPNKEKFNKNIHMQ